MRDSAGGFAEEQLPEKMLYVCVLLTQSCWTLCDPTDCSPPGSLCMGLSRQEYWSGLPFSFPGDLLNPGIKPESASLQADSLPSEPAGKSQIYESESLSQSLTKSSKARQRSELWD